MTDSEIERIVEKHGDRLFRYCLLILRNSSDAEDAVQETFLSLVRKNPCFRDAEHEKAWFFHVARNKCLDSLRKRKRQPEELEENDVVRGSDEAGEETGLFDALSRLTEIYRSVLCLYYYLEEMSVEGIASLVSRTPSAVKMRLKKGRGLLKNEMEGPK